MANKFEFDNTLTNIEALAAGRDLNMELHQQFINIMSRRLATRGQSNHPDKTDIDTLLHA